MRGIVVAFAWVLGACGGAIPVHLPHDVPPNIAFAAAVAVEFWNGEGDGRANLDTEPFDLRIVDPRGRPDLSTITIVVVKTLRDRDICGRTSSHLAKRVIYIVDDPKKCGTPARTLAHELGHAIRLRHIVGRHQGGKNLMNHNGWGWDLTQGQRRRASRAVRFWFGSMLN